MGLQEAEILLYCKRNHHESSVATYRMEKDLSQLFTSDRWLLSKIYIKNQRYPKNMQTNKTKSGYQENKEPT